MVRMELDCLVESVRVRLIESGTIHACNVEANELRNSNIPDNCIFRFEISFNGTSSNLYKLSHYTLNNTIELSAEEKAQAYTISEYDFAKDQDYIKLEGILADVFNSTKIEKQVRCYLDPDQEDPVQQMTSLIHIPWPITQQQLAYFIECCEESLKREDIGLEISQVLVVYRNVPKEIIREPGFSTRRISGYIGMFKI